GAGPSGLLLALLLSRHGRSPSSPFGSPGGGGGIPVTILEASHQLDSRPRAAHYGTACIPDLIRAGIIDKIRDRGFVLSTMTWRKPRTFEEVGGFESSGLREGEKGEDMRTHCLVLQDLLEVMLEECVERGVEVCWRHRVVGEKGEEKGAWVEVEVTGEDGEVKERKRFGGEGCIVVGADGANSAVRKGLFGDEFPGFTWDRTIIATNTYYDFDKFGWSDANFIIDPDNFFMAARISPSTPSHPALYRITYAEVPNLTHAQYLSRQPFKFQSILPGSPTPDQYQLLTLSPYRMHQRCAPSFRVGRVLLVADAAHLCNPWGGLGITGGFVDVGGLYDCLAGIWDDKADEEEMLELYSEKRMEKWKTIIDPVSQENFRRVSGQLALEKDEFLGALREVKGDEKGVRDVLLGMMAVRYDFTGHYRR
ncbi:FAD/NAD(P)-binding domain-containing protein, partial [Neurospora tetrasperma FGSC 2509]